MNIIIVGCGQVGRSLAKELIREGNDVTVIDTSAEKIKSITNNIDVMGVVGNGASHITQQEASVKNADPLIAVTDSDELNLLCCMTAHAMNPNLHTIARIRNPEYTEQAYRMRDAFALSMTFNPEHQAAVEIARLLKFPGFLKRDSFAKGRVEIVEIRVDKESPICNVPLSMLYGIVKCRVLVCTVLRDGTAITPDGQFVLQEGDCIFVTAPSDDLAALLKNLGIVTHKVRRVMIAGGGRVAYYLTELLQDSQMDVAIIESDHARCLELAARFPKAEVIVGDARDQSLLESQNISGADALVAVTGMDETNMVVSLYAHNRTVSQVVTRMEYLEDFGITGSLPLGSVISPNRLSSNNIVRYVRALQNQSGAALTIHSIAGGQAEAMEFRVDANTLHCGVPLKKLKLREHILLVGISSGTKTQIPNGDSTFDIGDSVVVVASGDTVIGQLNDIFA